MTEQHIALHVATRPILVAARLRATFERLGYTVAPPRPGQEPAMGAVSLLVAPQGPAGAWVYTDTPDALPDELGRLLSQELRATTITVGGINIGRSGGGHVPEAPAGEAAEVWAVEVAEEGRLVHTLALRDQEVLDGEWPALTSQLGQGRHAALLAVGLEGYDLSFAQAAALPRVVRFELMSRGGGEVIEIDPSLSCPKCGQAMRRVTGPHGAFYGCVRYPECKGRLTEKAASRS